jgi:protein TonB
MATSAAKDAVTDAVDARAAKTTRPTELSRTETVPAIELATDAASVADTASTAPLTADVQRKATPSPEKPTTEKTMAATQMLPAAAPDPSPDAERHPGTAIEALVTTDPVAELSTDTLAAPPTEPEAEAVPEAAVATADDPEQSTTEPTAPIRTTDVTTSRPIPDVPAPAEIAPAEIEPVSAPVEETPRRPENNKTATKSTPAPPAKKKPAATVASPARPASTAEPVARSPAPGKVGGGGSSRDEMGRASSSAYQAKLAAHLRRFRTYPPEAQRQRISGTAVIRFTVNSAGAVTAASLAGSSGHSLLDNEAVAMVRRASPFPPIPEDLGTRSVTISAPIRFGLR